MNTESRPTRRQFLKEVGFAAGGMAFASLAPGCNPSEKTTPVPETTPGNTTTPTTTKNSKTVTLTPILESSLPPAAGFVYETPSDLPPVMHIPGCTTSTALDRKYILEHMWVKMVAENIVAIGITEKMAALIAFLYEISLPPEGSKLVRGETYVYIHGAKLSLEFPNPVTGTVLQYNNGIFLELSPAVIGSPYTRGWLYTLQLANPKEWDELLTPQQYTDLNAKVI